MKSTTPSMLQSHVTVGVMREECDENELEQVWEGAVFKTWPF